MYNARKETFEILCFDQEKSYMSYLDLNTMFVSLKSKEMPIVAYLEARLTTLFGYRSRRRLPLLVFTKPFESFNLRTWASKDTSLSFN